MASSSPQSNLDNPRQFIYIVRYGLTNPPLVEGKGPFDSDIDPDEGMQHTNAIAKCLAETSKYKSAEGEFPTLVYCSPFRRCAHTAHEIAKQLQDAATNAEEEDLKSKASSIAVRVEEGLTEWLTPSLVVNNETKVRTHPKTPEQLVAEYDYDTIDLSYVSVNPSVHEKESKMLDNKGENGNKVTNGYLLSESSLDASTPGSISPEYPESENRLLLRARTTLDNIINGLVEEHPESALPSIVIVSHAPCLQALAFNLLGRGNDAAEQMVPWPLGGITAFSRNVSSLELGKASEEEDDGDSTDDGEDWKLEYYGKADHMPQEYKEGFKAWSLPGFSKTGHGV